MCLTGCSSSSSPSSGSGANTPACDPNTQSCPCCSAVSIKELAFSGNNVVEKDTTGDFPSPEWVLGRPQADQAPVSYARNRNVSFTAKFAITTAACRAGETVEVKGNATFGAASLEWTGTLTVNPGDTEASTTLTSNNKLPNEIGIFESTDIHWQMNPCSAGWRPAGTTRNVVYVTLGDPSGSPNYWTLLDISCRAAAGKSNETDFVAASFAPYRSKIGNGNGFRRKRDGTELTYYKFGGGTPSVGVFACSDILSRADGTGRCGAWARFMVAMHNIHGITSSAVFGVVPVSAPVLLVKNLTFNGAGTLPVPFTYVGNTECVKNDGIFGQGKNNPQFLFGDHALVRHATGIYDPSYGVGPKPDLKTWEDGGIAGLGEAPYLNFTYDGDTQYMAAHCSPGFIVYTAVAGDTLASIAARFGIASAAALYNHAYNAAYRAGHTTLAAPIAAGDTIYIPRAISNVAILRIA
jgi:hypothetical protein